jgi:RNA polymerase sigma-70 factor (ECF subfamily)
LLARFQAGDDGAFAELYARHRGPVTGYAWRMLGRVEEAEEVCTDTFCRLVDGRWRPAGTVRGYLFTVAHRLCLDRLRRRASMGRALLRLITGDGAASPEGALIDAELREGLDAALLSLPPDHRAVVLLYYAEELSSREVAEVVGCSDQQVRSKLAYARRRLRVLLEEGP